MNRKYFFDYASVEKNQIKRSQIIQKAYLKQKPSHRVTEFQISILLNLILIFILIFILILIILILITNKKKTDNAKRLFKSKTVSPR